MSMHISHSRPNDVAISISGINAGDNNPAFINSSAHLVNGNPGLPCVMTWATGSQTTDSVVQILLGFGRVYRPRVVGIVGQSLPPGMKITLAGREPTLGPIYIDMGNGSFTSGAPRSMQIPNNDVVSWFVLSDDYADIDGLAINIYNDLNGGTHFSGEGSEEFSIAEIWFGESWASVKGMDETWKVKHFDPSKDRRTDNSQGSSVVDTPYEIYNVSFSNMPREETWGANPPTDDMTIMRLWSVIDRKQLCAIVPRWRTPDNSAIDRTWLHYSAKIGIVTSIGDLPHSGGNFFTWGAEFSEYPVPYPHQSYTPQFVSA